MRRFAKVSQGKVVKVIVAEPSFFDTFVDSSPGKWIETAKDGSIRKNYAGIGYTYDPHRDAFIAPKPEFDSWVLNETTCKWEAPVPYPSDGKVYAWSERNVQWVLRDNETNN